MHDGVWLNPCGLTVSCQTCTLAGSTGPPGPSLTRRVCHRKKREREKREADSSPAGLQAAPLLARGPGQRGQGQKAEGGATGTTGVALGGQGRQKTLHSPGSLHSCPNQKLHLSICSNLNGPGQGPLLTVSPRRRCQQPIRRCDSSRSLDVLGRSSTLHCLSSRDCETASLPRQRQNGARRAVGAVIGNLDSPSPSRKRIPRLGTDLQNRASFHGNVKIARAHAPPSLHPPRSAHASWPCWPRTASPGPILRVRKLRLPPVTARVVRLGLSLFFFLSKIESMGSTDARVHDSRIYNRRVSCPRNSNPRPSLFTILAHLTCFLPVFPSGPVLYLISTSRPASISATTASTTTTTNADEFGEIQQ